MYTSESGNLSAGIVEVFKVSSRYAGTDSIIIGSDVDSNIFLIASVLFDVAILNNKLIKISNINKSKFKNLFSNYLLLQQFEFLCYYQYFRDLTFQYCLLEIQGQHYHSIPLVTH